MTACDTTEQNIREQWQKQSRRRRNLGRLKKASAVCGILLLLFLTAYGLWGKGACYVFSPVVPGKEAQKYGDMVLSGTKSAYRNTSEDEHAARFARSLVLNAAYTSTFQDGSPEDVIYRNYLFCLCKAYALSYEGKISELQYLRYWLPYRFNRVAMMRECMGDIKTLTGTPDGVLGMDVRLDSIFGRKRQAIKWKATDGTELE